MTESRMQFDFGFSRAPRLRRRDDEAPFRILVLADLGGGGRVPLGQRRPLGVDIDTFERVFERLAPRVELVLDGAPLTIGLRSLDDFHPDHLFAHLPPFVALRKLRAELQDPGQFQRAAAALGALSAPADATPDPGVDAAGDDIERLLGRPVSQPGGRAPAAAVDMTDWMRAIVAPHVVADISQEQQALTGALDAAIAAEMRRVLHDRAFQALEARWRGIDRLVRELDLGETLKLSLLDVTREELAQDLATHGDLTRSALHATLCGQETDAPDGRRWSLLVTDLAVGADLAELQLLATLGALAGRAGAPLLATARPTLLGCVTIGDLVEPGTWQPLDEAAAAFWAALRTSPLAPWIGLALPRILARLPYGKDSDPIGAFAFEELTARTHADYLWGSPALALALLAGQAFMENGWDLDLESGRDLGDLPSHVYREDDTPYQQPCAEVAMGEAAGLAVLRAGVMPFLSYRSRNAARLLGFQSIAEPARALAGAWTAG